MSPVAEPGISVVMPAYNMQASLAAALQPLVALLGAGGVTEVIVVDDCSTDRTADIAAAMGVRVVRLAENQGPAGARNVGAGLAQASVLWFVDADVVVHPDGAARIRHAFRETDVVAVFGSYDENPAAPGWLSRYKNLVHRFHHQRAAPDAATFWAGCGAVRAGVFAALGGFDAQTYPHPSIEDIELGYRLRRHGRIRVLPDLQGTHLKSWTLRDVLKVDILRRALPWSRLILRREGLSDTLNIGRAERARALLALALWLSLAMAVFLPGLVLMSGLLAGLAILANPGLFLYLRQRGGLLFALSGLLYHQVYYAYSVAVFLWCLAEVRLRPGTGS